MSAPDMQSRESMVEAGGVVKGVAVAIVTQNSNQDGEPAPSSHAVKVRYPWHEEERNSYWARIAVPMAGDGRGVCFLPEVGDEVLVAFERGDLRFPYVIGALWNGQHQPPEVNADGKNDRRVIRSRAGHTLTFDDGSKGAVALRLKDGKQLVLDDAGVQLQDEHGNRLAIASASGAMTIETTGKLTIKAGSIEISASTQASFKASANLKLESALININ